MERKFVFIPAFDKTIFLKLFLIIAFAANLEVVFVLIDMKLNIGFGDKMSSWNLSYKHYITKHMDQTF